MTLLARHFALHMHLQRICLPVPVNWLRKSFDLIKTSTLKAQRLKMTQNAVEKLKLFGPAPTRRLPGIVIPPLPRHFQCTSIE